MKNLKTDLLDELQERILVREGSSEKPVSKQRLVLKRLVMNAIKGDTRATTVLLNTMLRLLDVEHAGDAAVPLNDDESAIIAAFEERLRRRLKLEAVADQPINTNHMTE